MVSILQKVAEFTLTSLIIIFPGPPAQAYGLHKSLADEFPVRSGASGSWGTPWGISQGYGGTRYPVGQIQLKLVKNSFIYEGCWG